MIPVAITARNEGHNLSRVLRDLRAAIAYAEARLSVHFRLLVVLNDNEDDSLERLDRAGERAEIRQTCGGLVEAQRCVVEEFKGNAPFVIFSDADISVDLDAIYEISRCLLDHAEIQVAYTEKFPLPPARRTLLSRSLYLYNLKQGYQSRRFYFNGQLFGIRDWRIPSRNEIQYESSENSGFLHLGDGVRCDDIYLSRRLLASKGPEAIRLVNSRVHYRPPETLRGMYRKYQRMRLEIERLNILFPEMVPAHQSWGRRRFQIRKWKGTPLSEKIHYQIFWMALQLCKLFYLVQKIYYSYLSSVPCPTWLPILESKEEIR